MEVFGYRATHYKLSVWVISAMMAGLAGGLFASWTTFVDPNSVHSTGIDSAGVGGDSWGLASIWGSILGAMAFVLLEEGMRFLPFIPTEYIGQARQAVLGDSAGGIDVVQAAGAAREVQAMTSFPSEHSEYYALETLGDLEALWGSEGCRRAFDIGTAVRDSSIVRPNGSGEVDAYQFAERCAAAGWRNCGDIRGGAEGRQGARVAGTRGYAEFPGSAVVRPDKRLGQYSGGAYAAEAIAFDGRAGEVGIQGEGGGDTQGVWGCGRSETLWRWTFPTDRGS